MAYQIWLGQGGTFVAYHQFTPEESGVVALRFEVDVSRFDEIWITEEPAGAIPSTPNAASAHAWRATLVSN
jgi:hypothetical protein